MPKLKTKLTALFTAKIGKATIEIKVPTNLAENAPAEAYNDFVQNLHDVAAGQLSELIENSKLKLKNAAEVKTSHKAFIKNYKA